MTEKEISTNQLKNNYYLGNSLKEGTTKSSVLIKKSVSQHSFVMG